MKRVGITFGNPKKVGPYAEAVRQAGLEPVLISTGNRTELDALDGLMITGGPDLDPTLYGQPMHPAAETPDQKRDAMEAEYLMAALEKDLPVLGICRGLQLFNVVHGGSLHQHIEGHRSPGAPLVHDVEVEAGTKLAEILEPGLHPVNSRHHQVVDRLGAGLQVSATSTDGHVEGLERPDRRFAVAVQWHPEDLVGKSAESDRLFEAFARAVIGGVRTHTEPRPAS
ncbi:MAG: gamma-glutamyl-gamma-aminobutyrate hydrolase family protein [Bryobacteraceae bacterium]